MFIEDMQLGPEISRLTCSRRVPIRRRQWQDDIMQRPIRGVKLGDGGGFGNQVPRLCRLSFVRLRPSRRSRAAHIIMATVQEHDEGNIILSRFGCDMVEFYSLPGT